MLMIPEDPSDHSDGRSRCPACGHQIAVPLLDPEEQPFATLAWPRDVDEARTLEKFRLEFMRCLTCGHVFNRCFEYKNVPYSDKPNRMFNAGREWQKHLTEIRDLILRHLPARPTVVEIGCGHGEFLQGLQDQRPEGRFIGFDPHLGLDVPGHLDLQHELFDPDVHLRLYKPDLIISRHLLEHLDHPLGMIEAIALAAYREATTVPVFLEVPCIDRALETGRTVDFYYEHKSHFTSGSFRTMLERSGAELNLIQKGYNDEVIYGLVRLGGDAQSRAILDESAAFRDCARKASGHIRQQLSEIHSSGRSVAIWGGTGKASAFMNRYDVDSKRFPVVVDSDSEKVGTFVPGQGQRIQAKEELLKHPVDILIVPMQWRIQDIVHEIKTASIQVGSILLEYNGKLIDYSKEPNPY